MGYSSDVTDREWEIIEPLLPQKKKTRPPVRTKRQILNGIFYQLKNGCNWADLPAILNLRIDKGLKALGESMGKIDLTKSRK
jgi:Putative transposase of IS4/5 family (DUF4096)